MTNEEVRYFMSGLKTVIRRSWPTQRAFAEGVTSKVNLSNILRGNSGTSKNMVEKLADRAGMSVDDVIAVGRGSIRTRATDTQRKEDSTLQALSVNPEESSAELFRTAADYAMQLNDQVAHQVKSITTTIQDLIKERDRLLNICEQDKVLINFLGYYVVVINLEKEIVYCNARFHEQFGKQVGDMCNSNGCVFCEAECVLNVITTQGKIVQKVVQHDGEWFFRAAYPVHSATGKIFKVAIIMQPLKKLFSLVQDAGISDLLEA